MPSLMNWFEKQNKCLVWCTGLKSQRVPCLEYWFEKPMGAQSEVLNGKANGCLVCGTVWKSQRMPSLWYCLEKPTDA